PEVRTIVLSSRRPAHVSPWHACAVSAIVLTRYYDALGWAGLGWAGPHCARRCVAFTVKPSCYHVNSLRRLTVQGGPNGVRPPFLVWAATVRAWYGPSSRSVARSLSACTCTIPTQSKKLLKMVFDLPILWIVRGARMLPGPATGGCRGKDSRRKH